MMIFLQILMNDILPLLIFIGIGFVLDSRFKIDLNTYNKLTVYVILPSFVFYSIYEFDMDLSMIPLLTAGILLIILQFLLSYGESKVFGIKSDKREIFSSTSALSNTGNIGIALIVLIFSHPPYLLGDDMPYLTEARGTMIVLLILMSMAVNVFGMYLIGKKQAPFHDSLSAIVHMPMLYAVAAAFLVKSFHMDLTHMFIWPVLQHFSSALIVFVMITLGSQLHRTKIQWSDRDVWLAVGNRLLIGPALALAVITFYGAFSPITSQVFFIYAAVPSSVNLVLYAVEFKNHPDFATQIVMTGTILGTVTLTASIYLAQLFFPLSH